MNVAVGGNFAGAVGADTTFPQTTSVDYVRLYQATPKPFHFVTSFRDNFSGWKQVNHPFSAFKGFAGSIWISTAVQSLSFVVPGGMRNPVRLDQVRLTCSSDVTVTNTADSGAGSLRKALGSVCVGGTIRFAPALAGQTIT